MRKMFFNNYNTNSIIKDISCSVIITQLPNVSNVCFIHGLEIEMEISDGLSEDAGCGITDNPMFQSFV